MARKVAEKQQDAPKPARDTVNRHGIRNREIHLLPVHWRAAGSSVSQWTCTSCRAGGARHKPAISDDGRARLRCTRGRACGPHCSWPLCFCIPLGCCADTLTTRGNLTLTQRQYTSLLTQGKHSGSAPSLVETYAHPQTRTHTRSVSDSLKRKTGSVTLSGPRGTSSLSSLASLPRPRASWPSQRPER